MNDEHKIRSQHDPASGPRDGGDFGEKSVAGIEQLRQLIRHGNRRWKRLVWIEALGLAIAAPLIYLWLAFAVDNLFHLPVLGRWLSMALLLVALAWQARRLHASWRQAQFTDDQVALAMERNTPGGLENRLINTVQFAAAGHGALPSETRAAVVRENYERLRQAHIEQAARSRPAMLRIGMAGVAVAVGLGFHAFQPERFSRAAVRILMPFSNVAPVYRTRLEVAPGDVEVEPGGDVVVTIDMAGRIPPRLMILTRSENGRSTEAIDVPRGARRVTYRFSNLRVPLSYAVRGGDFTSPFYRIAVPVSSDLKRLHVTLRYPEYTGLPPRTYDSMAGNMEAVFGTEAQLKLILTRPAESVDLLLTPRNGDSDSDESLVRMPLDRESEIEFNTTLRFERSYGYRIESRQSGQPPSVGREYDFTTLPDEPPVLGLSGIVDGDEVNLDAVLALSIMGQDDFGLVEAGVFARLPEASETPTDWKPLATWDTGPERTRSFTRDWVLPVAATGAGEGDVVEIVVRGRDNDPLRAGAWHNGDIYRLTVGGESSRLQIEYERILRVETNLAQIVQGLRQNSDAIDSWARKLDPASGLRWDDQKNLTMLKEGLKALAATQSVLRASMSDVAREMPEDAGSLKISVAMLADTEMVRAIQMTEGVPEREQPGQMRGALGESRLTVERTLRSVGDMWNAFQEFRRNWELENMVPFVRMLGQRQLRMAGESRGYVDMPSESIGAGLRQGTARRQRTLQRLTDLAAQAFQGMSTRETTVGNRMAAAFAETSTALREADLANAMQQAAAALGEGGWERAAGHQEFAAGRFEAIYNRLRQVQDEVAQELMAMMEEMALDSPEAQAALKALKDGFSEQLMHGDLDVMSEIVNLTAMAEDLKNQHFENQPDKEPSAEGTLSDYISTHVSGSIDQDKERDFSIMTLAKKPGGQQELIPGFATEDTMEIQVLKEYQDVVGDLLEEADDVREEYESIVNLLLGQDVEAGASGKGGLGMASVSAAAPTGNQKPDTHDHGGASRIGRQGARAHGIAVGNESISRRGRDQAQESGEQAPDVGGSIKETLSDDPATDHSTGIGGREVESDQQSTFSVKDAGEWDDAMTDRMKDPQSGHAIVERAGAPLSPEVADRLRDMEGKQEQLIERIKRVKKELDNLYLPTDHLDEAMRNLAVNLDRLKQQPDPEAFRMQLESLDKLMGAVMVFDRPNAEFQPSLPRQLSVRGEILDEPRGPTLPGYEDAVKRYYERLAQP